MNDYLSKPFEEEDLIRLIAKWLGRETYFSAAKATTVTTSPLYDLDKLKQITRGDEKFIAKMLQVFITETTTSVSELDKAFEAKDVKRIKFLAHRMKSSLSSLSIASAATLAAKIESSEWTEQDYPELEKLINELKSIITEVIALIKMECLQPI